MLSEMFAVPSLKSELMLKPAEESILWSPLKIFLFDFEGIVCFFSKAGKAFMA